MIAYEHIRHVQHRPTHAKGSVSDILHMRTLERETETKIERKRKKNKKEKQSGSAELEISLEQFKALLHVEESPILKTTSQRGFHGGWKVKHAIF